jgi:hypothetical protein
MANETAPDIKHVVHISTGIVAGCKHCRTPIGGGDQFAESVNHYIQEHQYRLLHVGQQTEDGSEGPWQTTVAVLGAPSEGEYSMDILGR